MALAALAAAALGEQLLHLAPGLEPGPRATHKTQLAPVLALVRALVHLERKRTVTHCSVQSIKLGHKAKAGLVCRSCALSASADWLPVTSWSGGYFTKHRSMRCKLARQHIGLTKRKGSPYQLAPATCGPQQLLWVQLRALSGVGPETGALRPTAQSR